VKEGTKYGSRHFQPCTYYRGSIVWCIVRTVDSHHVLADLRAISTSERNRERGVDSSVEIVSNGGSQKVFLGRLLVYLVRVVKYGLLYSSLRPFLVVIVALFVSI
jgi:hypothetical protein